jgi:hypothetical protein
MPAFSDPPYPSNCLVNAFASTFERCQRVVILTVLRSSAVRENIPRGLPRGGFNTRKIRSLK